MQAALLSSNKLIATAMPKPGRLQGLAENVQVFAGDQCSDRWGCDLTLKMNVDWQMHLSSKVEELLLWLRIEQSL